MLQGQKLSPQAAKEYCCPPPSSLALYRQWPFSSPEVTFQLLVLLCQGEVCLEDAFGQSLSALEELLQDSISL